MICFSLTIHVFIIMDIWPCWMSIVDTSYVCESWLQPHASRVSQQISEHTCALQTYLIPGLILLGIKRTWMLYFCTSALQKSHKMSLLIHLEKGYRETEFHISSINPIQTTVTSNWVFLGTSTISPNYLLIPIISCLQLLAFQCSLWKKMVPPLIQLLIMKISQFYLFLLTLMFNPSANGSQSKGNQSNL